MPPPGQPDGDPLGNHRDAVQRTLGGGDAGAIKRLYIALGDDLHGTHAAGLDAVPVLSAPETGPTVVGRLDGVRGAILDAGCGPNPAVSIELARGSGRAVVALDIGWSMVDLARRVARTHGVDVLPVAGDVERLPFREGAFDGVVCDDCIEHLPDDAGGVRELVRVARRGAPVVLATPNRHNAFILRRRLHDRLRGERRPSAEYYVANSHLREYTWREFARLVEGSARITGRVPVGWSSGGWKTSALNRAIRLRPFHRLSQMIVVEAERT